MTLTAAADVIAWIGVLGIATLFFWMFTSK